ncbi:ABC transporter permease subunit [Alphaproteobacteria bacterium HT1-32]|nr:ABC transporter permease subunit [Alphaproteobacteria bacterium HT1-32]
MIRLAPAVAIVFLTAPVLFGLVGVVLPAFGWLPVLGGDSLSLEPWRQLAAQPGIGMSVVVSLLAGLATTAIALTVVMLFLAGAGNGRVYQWVRRAVSPLLSMPHAAAAFGIAFLIAPSGLIARFLSPWATGWERPADLLIVHDTLGLSMMLGLVVKEIPFLLLMSLAALPQIDPARRVAVARSLGYRPVTAWLKAVAPSLYPLIRLPVYAVIAFSSSVVDVSLILGPTNPPTLAVSIIRWFHDPMLEMRFLASAGAVLQLGVTGLAMGLWWLAERLVGYCVRCWIERGARVFCDSLLRFLGITLICLAVILAAAGVVALVINSFAGFWRFPDALPQAFSLRQWNRAGPGVFQALGVTFTVGFLATAISVVLVMASLENEVRRARPSGQAAMRILYLPLIVPQIAFLFGIVTGAEAIGFRPGLALVVAGHVIFVLPYVYLSLSESYRQLDPRWVMVARTLGAGPNGAFWRVRLPMLLAPCLTAVAIGLAVSVGQYLPTQLMGAGRVPTVTTEAVALAAGGSRRIIGVWALVQALVPAVGFALALMLPRLFYRNRRDLRDAAL